MNTLKKECLPKYRSSRERRFLELNNFYCGDFNKIYTKIRPKSIDLIFTSPPYNVGKKYDKYNDKKEFNEYLSFLNLHGKMQEKF